MGLVLRVTGAPDPKSLVAPSFLKDTGSPL